MNFTYYVKLPNQTETDKVNVLYRKVMPFASINASNWKVYPLKNRGCVPDRLNNISSSNMTNLRHFRTKELMRCRKSSLSLSLLLTPPFSPPSKIAFVSSNGFHSRSCIPLVGHCKSMCLVFSKPISSFYIIHMSFFFLNFLCLESWIRFRKKMKPGPFQILSCSLMKFSKTEGEPRFSLRPSALTSDWNSNSIDVL